MILLYNGSRPYLPLLACSIHFGLATEAEAFLYNGLRRDWRQRPLYIAGKDRAGNSVGCLVHGRYHGLYHRALTGTGNIFELNIACSNLDELLTDPIVSIKTFAAQHLKWCERRFRNDLSSLISRHLAFKEEKN